MILSKGPMHISDIAWYYEEDDGIDIIHEVRRGSEYISTEHVKIPWRMIRKSLARKDHKRLPKGKSQ